MGFARTIVREKIIDQNAVHFPPVDEEVNYFGFADAELKPYIRDLIFEAAENKTRLFLSHLTSTTHHPWSVPPSFKTEEYMGSVGPDNHRDMNDYLNTIRYSDEWLGEILKLIDEANIANSTLVVILGDHGHAFPEDGKSFGAYLNGHVSNFRVPIVFRHPHLPRIDISANATPLSILPTILDLLVQTKSLDTRDSEIASSLIHEYQGQSLLRPFKGQENGRQLWNMGIISTGGSMLSVASAATPFRLVLPLRDGVQPRFTHLEQDPSENHPLEAWTMRELKDK
ncbi:hypothetical protein FQN49_008820 [Arthroderma sp. PD_2]|nr:hypothetical protein FQN49_008820 [Arthroderma sp. PD_2]